MFKGYFPFTVIAERSLPPHAVQYALRRSYTKQLMPLTPPQIPCNLWFVLLVSFILLYLVCCSF